MGDRIRLLYPQDTSLSRAMREYRWGVMMMHEAAAMTMSALGHRTARGVKWLFMRSVWIYGV